MSRRRERFQSLTESEPESVRAHLKERIYGAFSCLTSLLVLASHVGSHTGPADVWRAMLDVVLSLASLWAASLFAEYLAHAMSHRSVTRHDWGHMVTSTWQIMVAGGPSLVVLLACAAGLYSLHTALWIAIWLVVAGLGLFAWLSVRRSDIGWVHKLTAMAALVGIGVVIVGLKVAVH